MAHGSKVVIGSANGLAGTERAFACLEQGGGPLDAVVVAATLVEDDPQDRTVGYGGLPNEEGIVELDAAVMEGRTHRAGGVAAVRNIRHVTQLARKVMEQTDHSLLAGTGAEAFARALGFPSEDLLTPESREIWLYWKQTRSKIDDWHAPPVSELSAAVREFFKLKEAETPETAPVGYQRSEAPDRPTGTVHFAARSAAGDIACATSTSGLAFKIPGRVGDSPLVGAGLYVDNQVGSCGSTGRGEANVQNCTSFAAVELMRQGKTPVDAGLEVLKRIVARTSDSHLLGEDGRPNFGLKVYVLHQDGRHAGASIWGPTKYAVTDETGTRLEECAFLYDKSTSKRS